MFLDDDSLLDRIFKADEILPQTGQIRNRLLKYIGEFPFFRFVKETLSSELYERDKYLKDEEYIKLIDLDDYKSSDDLADRIVKNFESLPWQYTITIKLPSSLNETLSDIITEWPISENARLVRISDEISRQYPINSDNENTQRRVHHTGIAGALAGLISPRWEESAIYMQTNVEGFIGRFGGTIPAVEAEAFLRSFYGLGIALRLFKIEPTFTIGTPFGQEKTSAIVHRRFGSNYQIDGKYELQDHHSSIFRSIKLHDHNDLLSNRNSFEKWLNICLSDISSVLRSGKRGEAVLRAARWFFDSYDIRDESLNFLQTVIVLEVLLGEKSVSDVIGISQLLGNRCAYLIGKSHEDREDIKKEIQNIYSVRSSIVHSGHDRLTSEQRVLFHKLRWICRRVIQEEVRLLKADSA
ncbi:MAG: hypothetical protein ACR2OX_08355 [Methyloligellaceae bacterium]